MGINDLGMSDEFDMDKDGLGMDLLMSAAKNREVINVGEEDDDDDNGDDNEESSAGSVAESQESQEPREHRETHRPREYTSEEIADMKQELLYQMDRLEKRGVRLSRKFNMSSSYEDMKAELERVKRDRELMASMRFQRMVLSTCVTGIEFLNTRYDPFDVKLDGWSEAIHENMGDYDDIFEELHDKYKGKARMAPELKLMFMLGGSAVQFHLTNTMFKTAMPGFDQVMKQNPDLMRQFSAAAMAAASQQVPLKQPPPQPQGGGGFFGGLGNLFMGSPKASMAPETPLPKMRGPTNADDILRDFNRDDVISTLSDNDAASMNSSKNGQRRKKDTRRTMEL